MKKKIGILGGISLASTLEYARTLAALYYEEHRDYYYPEIIIYSLDFQKFTDMENENRMDDYVEYILYGVNALHKAGADFVAMAANSPHSVFERVAEKAPLPMLSIVDAVGRQATARGMKTLLLTGIKYTMQNSFYPRGLGKYGITVITPAEEDQNRIDDIIFGQLAREIFTEETREEFKAILGRYPADGVILGCTELPLLLHQNQTDIPLLDSLNIHCREILKEAVGG